MARRTNNQSTMEKRPGEPKDHPEAVEQLGEAIGGAMALSSCTESVAGVGGDGIDFVDPRLPSKRGSRRTYVWARRSSWYARGGLRRCDGAELLCRRRFRRGRRQARFWSVGGAPVRKQRPVAEEKQRPTDSSRFGLRQEIHRPGAWPAAGSSRAWSLRAG
ncbi:hypothetical protein ACQJBY_044125 [Aegilops geniculata]